MIKLFCKAAVVVSLATLFGCSSTPSVEKMQADVASYSLPKAAVADKGLVYVVRPSNVGMAPKMAEPRLGARCFDGSRSWGRRRPQRVKFTHL